MQRLLMMFALWSLPFMSVLATEFQLPNWTVQTASGDNRELHDWITAQPHTLVAVVASTSQENGQAQQQAMMNMHQQLLETTPALPAVLHLNIIAGAPRFVHGFIRRGIVGEYQAPVQDDQVLLMFPRNYDEFTAATAVGVDNYGTWFLVTDDGRILWSVKQNEALDAEVLTGQLTALLDR
ncbi:hypothetical protein NFC81_01590 [Salinispirillum sp. LH 10-3-1]|uniref:YtfJ family protein n=1 Tax=Salinispirillum sp. LH 10-3-1 TaxID=2952525 RepID=A0AB38YGT4_9GAMM